MCRISRCFRALTKNPRGRAIWEFRGSPGGAFDGEHGLDLAIVRSCARSQEHLTNSRAKKKTRVVSSTAPRRSRSTGAPGTSAQRSPGRGFRLRCAPHVCSLEVSQGGQSQYSSSARTWKKLRSLHLLGKCYLLPGEVVMNYTFAGNALPKKADVWGLCARVGVQDGEDSSARVSSSSSSDVS